MRSGGLGRINHQSQPVVDISRKNFVVGICRSERQNCWRSQTFNLSSYIQDILENLPQRYEIIQFLGKATMGLFLTRRSQDHRVASFSHVETSLLKLVAGSHE